MTNSLCFNGRYCGLWAVPTAWWLASFSALSSSAAEPVSETHRVDRGIVYGEAGGEKLLADVYLPTDGAGGQSPDRPAVLLVHGGGWCFGSRGEPTMVLLGKALSEAGYVAVSIDYRLVKDAPDGGGVLNRHPAAIEDCRQAVLWMHEHADRYRIDVDRLGAYGESAGGHLVSLLGTEGLGNAGAVPADVPSLRAVVNVFGPTDLTKDFSDCKLFGGGTVQVLVDRLLGGSDKESQQSASPIFQVSSGDAAFLTVHGSDDPLVPVSQSREFHAALSQAGRESKYIELKGAGHGFLPANQKKLVSETLAFFNQHLKQTTPAPEKD